MNSWFLFIIGFLAFVAVITATVFNSMASIAIKDLPEFDNKTNPNEDVDAAAKNADWAAVVCGIGAGLILISAIIYTVYYVRSGGLGGGTRWMAGIISIVCILILLGATFLSVASFTNFNQSKTFGNPDSRANAYTALFIASILESVSVATFTIFLFYAIFPSTSSVLQSTAGKFSNGAVKAVQDLVSI